MPKDTALAAMAMIRHARIEGTGDADTLIGIEEDDVIEGLGGDDVLTAGTGSTADTLLGGDGNDALTGNAGANVLSGELGDDTLSGGLGDDVIDGGPGTDTAVLGVAFADVAVTVTDTGFDLTSALGRDSVAAIELFQFADQTLTAAQLDASAGGTGGGSGGGDITPLTGVRAPVGNDIASRADPAIGDALFGQAGTELDSISYVGSPNAIGLLPEGYTVTDGIISVSIDNGVFLTTGGGPGETNTSGSFGENLGEAGNALLDDAVAAAFDEAGGTNDAAVLTFTFEADLLDGETTLALNVFFGSDEYPEFADSSFVDIAAVYVNGVNYALFNNDPAQPLSIVGESINTPGNFYANGNNTFDTEYDGISALLTVLAPVVAGTNTVTVGIADTGDSIYDSGLWVGNLGGSDIDSFGSFVNVPGTEDNDIIDLNIAPQIVDLVGGRDVVRGDLAEADNDVINSWGDNDLLIWTEVFDPEAVSVTADDTRAVIEVDLNGDGTAESRTLLYANFSEASFVIETVSGGVQLYSVGVLPDPPVILFGTEDGDKLRGGTGNDQLSGGAGQDSINGGEGDDTLAGGAGDDSIQGDFGVDSIGGGLGDDTIEGGDSGDILGGGQGNDTVLGGLEDDRISGGAGNDLLDGQSHNDTLGGSFGNDSVYGGTGDDSLGGGTGQDSLYGGRGNDTLGGGEGNDLVQDSHGSNFLAGGGRNDTVIGGTGADTIVGGTGNDRLSGRAGADLFVFNDLNAGEADVITDFEVGVDTIRISGATEADLGISFAVIDDAPGLLLELRGHDIFLQGLIESDFDADDLMFV